MQPPEEHFICQLTGATAATRVERLAKVWSGYGQVVRYALDGHEMPFVVVKHIVPVGGQGRSHQRKMRSYEVEQRWYQSWAARCPDGAPVPRCFYAGRDAGGWLFVFEDMDQAGYSVRDSSPQRRRLESCLHWLAAFHAAFLHERPRGLWKVGTYWHLAARPDELRSMARGRLRDAAEAIDQKLSRARHLTLVHGDAKPCNFCFSQDGRRVAAVDFQYVGGGCGVKDVAYLLSGLDQGAVRHGLKVYFDALRSALPPDVAGDVVAEWRELYCWAWADFQRFLGGWAPYWRPLRHEEAMTQQVLAQV